MNHLNSTTAAESSRATGIQGPVAVGGHEFQLYTESWPLIDAMVSDIATAQNRVWMETYIFLDDRAGRIVADALCERAKAGLDVRLMIDGFGSFSTSSAFLGRMRAAGVRLHVFHDFLQVLRGPRVLQALNQRNHRKLLVIDDAVAYFGGMNVIDPGGIHGKQDLKQKKLPSSAGWRDVHVRMTGPRQTEIATVMERLWNRVHREPRGKPMLWHVPRFNRTSEDSIYFFDSRPTFKDRRPHRVLVPLIRQARSDITLAMAYFLPMGRVLRALVKARRRGVRVRVIVPGQSDVKIVQWATRHFYEYLLKRDIEIYERRDRMLHSKAMVIDGAWSVVGSCNLDARSLRINLEFFGVIHNEPFAAVVRGICEEEMAASDRVNLDGVQNRSWWQRWRDRIAWSLRKVL